MPEELIVQHCSPTLAGVKTANLFTTGECDHQELLKQIAEINQRLNDRGIRIMVLGYTSKKRPLIYVYRMEKLRQDLRSPKIKQILKGLGYDSYSTGKCLTTLIHRLQTCTTFPHEIGCFLGYPAEDVQGFMDQNRPCKCYGVWKVYGNEGKARKLFRIYDDCKESYLNHFHHGASLEYLTVILQEVKSNE